MSHILISLEAEKNKDVTFGGDLQIRGDIEIEVSP